MKQKVANPFRYYSTSSRNEHRALVSAHSLTSTLCVRAAGAAPKKKKEPEGGPRLIIPIEKIRDKQKGKAYELPSAPADEVDYHWKLFQAKQAENAAKKDTGPTAIRVVVRLRPFNDREKVSYEYMHVQDYYIRVRSAVRLAAIQL